MASTIPDGTYYGRVISGHRFGDLTFAETTYGANQSVPVHAHANPLFALLISGVMEEQQEGERKRCTAGSLICLPVGAVHGHRFLSDASRIFTIQLGPEWSAAM